MTRITAVAGQTRGLVFVTTLSLVMLMSSGMGQAQTTNITSSGLNTHVSAPTTLPNGMTNYDITGGSRPGNGPNLFHSFGDFNVPTNNIANFLNETALPTSNILGRVTGGHESNIFGTIQTTGFGAANLYLINPAGFLFGPTATLNVGGSFTATTADYLKMTDGAKFYATAPQPTLSIAPVAAFGFLASNPAAISVQGSTLAVQPHLSISLVGGNQGFTYTKPDTGATAIVPGGVTITGGKLVAPDGQILLASVASSGEAIPNTDSPSFPDFTTSSFSQLGQIHLSQALLDVSSNGLTPPEASDIVLIKGDQLIMDASSILAQNPAFRGSSLIGVFVNSLIANGSTLSVNAELGKGNDAGNIVIFGSDGLDSSRKAPPTTTITLNQTSLTADAAFGESGVINLIGKTINLTNSNISTTSGGNEGFTVPIVRLLGQNISMNGGIISTNTNSGAAAGEIFIEANNIILSNGATISSASTGSGNAGYITITAPGTFQNNGGTVTTSTSGTGEGGTILVDAGIITLTNRAQITTVSTKSLGPKDAGSITLTSASDLLLRNSTVATSAVQASGGNIKLTAPNIVRLVDSTLTSSVQGQAGSNGGNINIDPQVVVIQNSQILAKANAGAGGNIFISATGAVLVDPNSSIKASSATGINGSVNINAPIQVLSGALVPLTLAYSQAGLSGDRCAADPQGQFSSFVQTGRDGVPQVPGALSPSPLSFLNPLTSGSWGSPLPNLAAARLGLDSVRVNDSTLFRFHSACRS